MEALEQSVKYILAGGMAVFCLYVAGRVITMGVVKSLEKAKERKRPE